MSALDTFTVTIPLTATPPANQYILRAPSDSYGGGLTVVAAYGINQATTSGTATFTVALHKYSAAGTAALGGTVAAALGGTADHWTDDVPKSFTIDSTHRWIDAGEWVVLNYAAVAGGAPTAGAAVVIHYHMGRS
jgi:hypothetical protein